MSWGKDLWDQTDVISAHTIKGIEFLERYCTFVKDRCGIEQQYAAGLRNLVKKHQIKKKEDDDLFTTTAAFRQMLNELNDIAGQHEATVEGFQVRIIGEIAKMVKEFKEQRKRLFAEVDRLEQNRLNSVETMKKSRKDYEKACREAEASDAKYKKADADIHLSRAEVEKAKLNSLAKTQVADDAKATYACELEKTNKYQRQFYTDLLPNVLQKLQDMEVDRINQLQHLFKVSVEIECSVLPIIERCLAGMTKEVNKIDPSADCRVLVDSHRSGYGLPEEFPFVDLSSSVTPSSSSDPIRECTMNGTGMLRVHGGKQLQRALSGRKKGGTLRRIFGSRVSEEKDFNDLPPSQQCKRLEALISRCDETVEKRQAEKQGLLRMKEAYSANPSYGDPESVAGQLNRCEIELIEAVEELKRLKMLHAEATSKLNTPINASLIQVPTFCETKQPKRCSVSDESLSRISDTTSRRNSSSQDVHSFVASESSFRNADSDSESANNSAYYNNPNDAVVLGKAVALYDFVGGSQGMLSIKGGEELLILEVDTGDGWTKVVRKVAPNGEGFVPSAYLKLEFFDDP